MQSHCLTLAVVAASAAILGFLGDVFVEDDNFHVVTADLYRAGQLRSDEWSESFREHPYRGVINLRGSGPQQSWYRLERGFADAHGLAHYDIALSDTREPSLVVMNQLVDLMRAAPKPLLIHCRAGADRSGLAAALYLYAIEGRSPKEAAGQLSLFYGHFPWFNQTVAMDRAFATFVSSATTQHASVQ